MKTNNILKIVIGLVFTALLASCVRESLHPVSNPDKAVIDNRLTGSWTGKIEDELVFIHFLPKSEGKMEIVVVSYRDDEEKTGHWLALNMFPSNIGKYSYMNIKFVAQSGEPFLDEPSNFLLFRYRISKDGKLTIWNLTESAVIEAIKSGLNGEVNKGKWVNEVKITAATNELSEYIRKSNPEQLFGDLVGDFYRLSQEKSTTSTGIVGALESISKIIETTQPLDTTAHTTNKREGEVFSEKTYFAGKEGQRVVNLPIRQLPEAANSNSYKLSVNILLPEKKLIKAGVYEPELKVAIRNQDPLARPRPFPIALREVYWEGQKEEQQSWPVNERLEGWLRPLMGSAGMNEDGSIDFVSHMAIAHTLDSIPITKLKFETGLIRTNNELIVPLPLKPNNEGKHRLVIDFVEILAFGDSLLEEKTDEYHSRFIPITTYKEQIHERVCRAYVPLTCDEGAKELPILKAVFNIQLKLDEKPIYGKESIDTVVLEIKEAEETPETTNDDTTITLPVEPTPWEAFQAVKDTTGERYVYLRDKLLSESGVTEKLHARMTSKDWRTAVTARILQGWLDHAEFYRKFLADLDSVDIEAESLTRAGPAGIWDGFARIAKTELKLGALPLAWEIVLKQSEDWPDWKVITALKILWVVPHKLSVDPVLWLIDSNEDLSGVAARTLAHLPRETVRKRIVAAKARHESIARVLGDALEEMDDLR